MVKEKVTLFFCNIVGTFDSGKLFLINNLDVEAIYLTQYNITNFVKSERLGLLSYYNTETGFEIRSQPLS